MHLEDLIRDGIRMCSGIVLGLGSLLLICFGVAIFLAYIKTSIVSGILLGGIVFTIGVMFFLGAILIIIDY